MFASAFHRYCLLLATLVFCIAPAAQAQVRFHGEASGASVAVMSWRDIPFRTVVRQQHDFSCGSAALATLLTYQYGRKTTEAEIFNAMFAKGDQDKIRRVGFSMLDMKHFLEARGIKADGFRLTLDELSKRKAPSIALIDLGRYRHFVVVKGVSGDKVLVGDPALGLRTFTKAEFGKMWNGIAFALYNGPDLPKPTFNLASDWSPWSTAPTGAVLGGDTLNTLAAQTAPLYQITSIRTLDTMTAGGGR